MSGTDSTRYSLYASEHKNVRKLARVIILSLSVLKHLNEASGQSVNQRGSCRKAVNNFYKWEAVLGGVMRSDSHGISLVIFSSFHLQQQYANIQQILLPRILRVQCRLLTNWAV